MTPREFSALKHQHEEYLWRWGFERAQFSNVNFQRDGGGAWVPEDFFAPHRADAVRNRQKHQSMRDKMAELEINTMLMQPVDDSNLPAWARPEFHRHKAQA